MCAANTNSPSLSQSQPFEHSSHGLLTSKQSTGLFRPSRHGSKTYDNANNILSATGVGTYTYPTQGSSAVRPHAVTSAGSWAFTYDANGNQTQRLVSAGADRTIAWDGDNRPISVTTPSGTVAYL